MLKRCDTRIRVWHVRHLAKAYVYAASAVYSKTREHIQSTQWYATAGQLFSTAPQHVGDAIVGESRSGNGDETRPACAYLQ